MRMGKWDMGEDGGGEREGGWMRVGKDVRSARLEGGRVDEG